MSYILFYKTEDMLNDRDCFAMIYQTKEEAFVREQKLLQEGLNGQKVIMTIIKEGMK